MRYHLTVAQKIHCYGCGAWVEFAPGAPHKYIGASAGCWTVFRNFLAWEYQNLGNAAPTIQIGIDAYAVQHPGRPSMRSVQSMNLHLCGLHLVLEENLEPQQVASAYQAIWVHSARFQWLEPPHLNGKITVKDVADLDEVAERADIVRRWAADVWNTWRPHQATIREMVRTCLTR